jgi:hypothetical protein
MSGAQNMQTNGLGVLLVLAMSAGTSPEYDKIVIADAHDWVNSPAFLVDAPRSVQRRMAPAVDAARKSKTVACAPDAKTAWLCEAKKFRYFQAIAGNGDRLRSGYACPDEDWLTRHKYYSFKEITDASCIQAQWDADQQRYYLLLPDM